MIKHHSRKQQLRRIRITRLIPFTCILSQPSYPCHQKKEEGGRSKTNLPNHQPPHLHIPPQMRRHLYIKQILHIPNANRNRTHNQRDNRILRRRRVCEAGAQHLPFPPLTPTSLVILFILNGSRNIKSEKESTAISVRCRFNCHL